MQYFISKAIFPSLHFLDYPIHNITQCVTAENFYNIYHSTLIDKQSIISNHKIFNT